MEENKSSGKSSGIANLKPFKKGQSGNPEGKKVGQRNYATIYREALIKLASINNKTPEELEEEILSSGLLNARKGDYRFYKDILDRLYGQPKQSSAITGNIKVIFNCDERGFNPKLSATELSARDDDVSEEI